MDIFGIGPTELIFIILIALILFGPKEMEKTGRTIGRWLRDMTKSDGWRAFRDTSREIRNLPNRLMREANIEELKQEVGEIGKEIEESADVKGFGTWSTPGKKIEPKAPQSKPKPAEANKELNTSSEPAPPAKKESDKESEDDA